MKTNFLRTTGLLIAWLAACYALFFCVVRLVLDWDFFDWSPKYDARAMLHLIGAALVLTGMWFLARATSRSSRACRVVSLLLCLLVSVYAIALILPAEPKSTSWLGRSEASPFWFRGGSCLLLCLPGVFWLLAVLLQNRRKDSAE
jgi:hypothetical protein